MRRRRLALLTAIVVVAACGGDGASPDERVFCTRLERLADNDPFRVFGDRATPREVELAFSALVARADELLDVAPGEARAAARDFAESAAALDELLAAAGFDGAEVDARAYRDQQVRYAEAAALLERYLDSEC